ncbi:hypothetical protein BC936DRAFT_145760 [Jimgerdemannia flammicorona]|uniref:Uncharacterized protein n=2 Tax=Jimgerdemannia flammicorona TaxID=994334 RepID=A0A433QMK5_9FUNG|nr:hypothetical protein BC936DRAFT_145760 [Jimgerdemannia flammicorona]RUS31012.1 hypothetical protein BC938DRAFT_478616 [Jimgerdemannia flammicorona]
MGLGKNNILLPLQNVEMRYLLIPLSLALTYLALRTTRLDGFYSEHKYAAAFVLSLVGSLVSIIVAWDQLKAPAKFIYSCFLKPLGDHGDNQASRLDTFYQDQAEVYDATRGGFLRGRTTMLKICAAQLKEQLRSGKMTQKPVWIDLGGGTGWNIERMNDYFPIEKFEKVYLVDLCGPLCKVARERFEKRGWDNVVVVCDDAAKFQLPGLSRPNGKIGLVTMSYSLSMIDNYFPVIDRVQDLLSPEGIFGVVDFYVSGRSPAAAEKLTGHVNRQCSWFTRFFWTAWFDFDHINLAPGRRDYLEYRFGSLKAINARNHFIIPWLVKIPYYVWLGCAKHRSIDEVVAELGLDSTPSFTRASDSDPEASGSESDGTFASEKSLRAILTDGQSQLQQISPQPLSSFHYQNKSWRLPYDPSLPKHTQFRSYIYAFTWEDPRVDLEFLNLTKDDTMFVITSAGDNALEYALQSQPKRIHCIDMNPCQNHLLELKLAGISSLNYDDFWRMFGDGKHHEFETLLHDVLSPHLSSHAFQYWDHNVDRFAHKFYKTGYSGLALGIVEWWVRMQGLHKEVHAMCHARTIEEQKRIYEEKIRPAVFSPMLRKVLNNPMFMWNALGVPINQMNMYLEECTTRQYMEDTLDPIINRSLFRNDQYFYHVVLMQKYTHESCPSYLTEKGFQQLKKSGALDAFRLHTDSILNVLKSLPAEHLTRTVVMDHMDWFDRSSSELEEEILEMARTTAKGGHVYWRSAGRVPWYNRLFEKYGFKVEPLGVREIGSGVSLDRVNMYASFYRGVKVGRDEEISN